MSRLALAVCAAAIFGFAVSGCLEATQVSFNITTDIPCEAIGRTAITAGLEGETEKAAPLKVVKSCTANGMVGAVGTYAVHPKANGKYTASFKVTVAVASDTDVETACVPSMGYRGCVVARRRINFVPHRGLKVPVELLVICKDVQCDENSTCSRLGRCVDNTVDLDQCNEQGDCTALVTNPGDGVQCVNVAQQLPLNCYGEEGWCVRTTDGARRCAAEPDPAGSYQCRRARDCGPHLRCVTRDGILGRCVVDVLPTDTVLCTPDDIVASCSLGMRTCVTDAGFGLLSCSYSDSGVGDGGADGGSDGGNPNPNTDGGLFGTGQLYVADRSDLSITRYPISWNPQGVTFGAPLTLDGGGGRAIRNMQLSSDRKWVFTYDTDIVRVYARDLSTGALAFGTAYNPGLSPGTGRIVVHPNDRFMFTANDCGNSQNTTMSLFDPSVPSIVDNLDPTNMIVGSERCTGTIGSPDGLVITSDGGIMYSSGVALEASRIDPVTGIAVPFSKPPLSLSGSELALVRDDTMLLAVGREGALRSVGVLADGSLDITRTFTAMAPALASELTVNRAGTAAWVVGNLSNGANSGTSLFTVNIDGTGSLSSTMSHDFGSPTADVASVSDGSWVFVTVPGTGQINYAQADLDGLLSTTWLQQQSATSAPAAMLFVKDLP